MFRLLFVLSLALFSSLPAAAQNTQWPKGFTADNDGSAPMTNINHFDQIIYESTGCVGGCRRIIINGDRTIEIRGTETLEGELIEDTITRQQMNDLVTALNASAFFSLPTDLHPGHCFDAPDEALSVKIGDQMHGVHFQACGPVPVQNLLGSINRIAADIKTNHALSKAEEGDPAAQDEVGNLYYFGRNGIAQNTREAIKWWRKAADQGISHAQDSIGNMYASGQVVQQDYAEAYFWFSLSSLAGPYRMIGMQHAETAAKNLSPEQIEAVKNRVQEWKKKHPAPASK